ncbi:MAG: hypothetical protein KDC03_18285 [Flavobacteriales bacterium]|nr:hypothetical protein [Flavobacteriales bacterium]
MQAAGTDTRIVQRIYLSWRTGAGATRRLVGLFWRVNDRVDFKYILDHHDIFDAVAEGFIGYPDMPPSVHTYKDVLPVIARRLVDPDRSDRVKYLEQWNATDVDIDDFDRIALTQAWLTNDRFEFLGEFEPKDGLNFVTDLAGQSHYNVPIGRANCNDPLTYDLERIEGYEEPAVNVYTMQGEPLGRVKQVHNRLFSHPDISNYTVELCLKDSEQNGVLKKLFVEVRLSAK